MASHAAEGRPTPRTSWIVWVGLGVVLLAAAALSFEALTELALAVGIRPALAWLLPVVVDAGAAVSTGVWLGRASAPDAARFAGRMTVGLLVVTVLGNAGQLGMAAFGIVPPWWVAGIVGSIPPAVVWSAVHLVVLLVRRSEVVQTTETAPVPQVAEVAVGRADDDELLPKVREWIAAQSGPVSQRQLRSEFSIGPVRAKRLLEAVA